MQHNFKIGDKVKIVRRVDEEEELENPWVSDMNDWVGKVVSVLEEPTSNSIKLYRKDIDDYWYFPVTCIEPIAHAQ